MTQARFPVMYSRGDAYGPLTISRQTAELAYSAYTAKYGRGQSLDRIGERGGWHAKELDTFVPEWRNLESESASLRAEIARLQRSIAHLCHATSNNDRVDSIVHDLEHFDDLTPDLVSSVIERVKAIGTHSLLLQSQVDQLEFELALAHQEIAAAARRAAVATPILIEHAISLHTHTGKGS